MKAIHHIYDIINGAPKRFGIIMHQKPDADAMGSTIALSHILRRKGHYTTVISPTNWAMNLNWMTEGHSIMQYDYSVNKSENLLADADYVFCLDFNNLSRTKSLEDYLTKSTKPKVLIDHHREPQTEMFAYGISDVQKSSTCEMVYDLIVHSGNEKFIDAKIAQLIYAGAMTDTGSFRFAATNATVHEMVAQLKRNTNFDHSIVHDHIFDNFLENRLRFMGHVLSNCMEVFYEYNTVLIQVPFTDLQKYDIKTGDTEGIVNLPQAIQGIKMVAIIIDRGDEIKMSFRSKGNVDVNSFARKYFNGGGHFNAAGGSSKKTLQETVANFITAMEENADMLADTNLTNIKN
jgi:bifunctional oligoribonuclease and PAP phosphatase NrnA